MIPVEVRAQLTDALRLDLVGPGEVLGADGRVLGDASEILPQRPSTCSSSQPVAVKPKRIWDCQRLPWCCAACNIQGLPRPV